MEWLNHHAPVISALASTGMMLIWVGYAWLFYQEFRRQRGSDLFIHEAGGGELRSVCLLVNLSREPVHVLCSLATRDGATLRLQDRTGQDDLSVSQRARQGPLACGEIMTLGVFEDIYGELEGSARGEGGAHGELNETQLIEIRVAAIHGFRQWPVGARRRFRVDVAGKQVRPATTTTEQLHSRRDAREVQRWIAASHGFATE